MQRHTTIFVFAMIAVLLLGVVGSAAAQGPGGDDTPPAQGPAGPEERGPRGDRDGSPDGNRPRARFAFHANFSEADVAAAFGISAAELEAYLDDGLNLREIAQELDINLDNVLEPLREQAQAEQQATLAAAFGISVEELEAYIEADMSLSDIAQELNANLDNVRETMRQQVEAERNEILATALGISVDELEGYIEADMSLNDIATELGIDLETVRDNLPFNGADFNPRQGRPGRDGRPAPNNPGTPDNAENSAATDNTTTDA